MDERRFERRRCLVAGTGPLAVAIAARLEDEGGTLASLSTDPAELPVTEERIAKAVHEAVQMLGGIDVCVTAPDVREDRSFLEIDDESWERVLDGNLKLAFLVGREAARAMKEAGGVIVHVGSDLVQRPEPHTASFVAAKGATHLLTAAMSLDLAPDGVRVCAVAACDAGEEAAARKRPGTTDVAAAVAFCASGEASYVFGSTFFLTGPSASRS
jgi:NAD(P)-dependent dehydrogenase (short-subunit alcohol dehydrogenase family)